MTDTVNQTGPVKSLLIEKFDQIIFDLAVIIPVGNIIFQVLKHSHNFDIGPAVTRTLERPHGCGNGGIGIRTAGRNHMHRERGIITAAVFRVKHQCQIQQLLLQSREFAVMPEHMQEICGG
ncbi:MAG: hypothetical protein BWX55_01561 [Deltaproteobacteria bacterium ADurb.Bin022]|nr:MAG: hypothetical protein BWX55_01561 [Deltaproteobacteria bacterium ADurb.Bin022]